MPLITFSCLGQSITMTPEQFDAIACEIAAAHGRVLGDVRVMERALRGQTEAGPGLPVV